MKKEIRKKILSARDGMSQQDRRAKSREIEERLFSLPEFRSARSVLFFASFRSEVDTIPMIRRALGTGKSVILPKVKGANLELFAVSDYDLQVSSGTWGIPEPEETTSARVEDVDIVIVPGAAFDSRGNRLGYGAGFYDKLLSAFTGMTIALAFEMQMLPQVPADLHDMPVKKMITETRVITACVA